ncbi:MAG: MFS transporter [Dehalococcoidia bacterium]
MVVACCTVLIMVSVGVSYSFGFFFLSLQNEFGWDRMDTSVVFSVYMVVAGLTGVLAVVALKRFGARTVLLIMGATAGLSLFIASKMESQWLFCLAYSAMLPQGIGGMYLIAMITGARRWKGGVNTAYLVIGTGIGLGGIVMAPVCARLITAYGWRDAYLILGIITAAVFLLIGMYLKDSALTYRRSETQAPISGGTENYYDGRSRESGKGGSVSRNTWLVPILWLSCSFSLHIAVVHIIPRISDMGYSLDEAARVIILMGVAMVLSRIFTANISESVDRKFVGIAFALIGSIAMFWLVEVNDIWGACLFAALCGMSWGGIGPAVIKFTSDQWIRDEDGARDRMAWAGWIGGGALGAFFGGWAFELADHYKFAFFCGAGAMMLATVCLWNLKLTENEEKPDAGVIRSGFTGDNSVLDSDDRSEIAEK